MNKFWFSLGLMWLWGCSPMSGATEKMVPSLSSAAIMDGEVDQEHPGLVGNLMLKDELGGEVFCSGTLIGRRSVLVAGNCLVSVSSSLPVESGVFALEGVLYEVSEIKTHEEYSLFKDGYDIGLLRLSRAVDGLTLIPLAQDAPEVGQEIILVGLGTNGVEGDQPQEAQRADNKVAEVTEDAFTYTGTGDGEGNTCVGDAGGPTFRIDQGREVLIGVHVGGSQPCGEFGVDTRVDHYYPWIEAQAGGDLVNADGTAPEVRIEDIDEGEEVLAASDVQLTATDDLSGVIALRLYLDDELIGTQDQSPAFFPLDNVAEGEHLLRAEAEDVMGNVGSLEISIKVGAGGEVKPPVTPGDPVEETEESGGCAVAGRGDVAGALWGLWLLALVGTRRWRVTPS